MARVVEELTGDREKQRAFDSVRLFQTEESRLLQSQNCCKGEIIHAEVPSGSCNRRIAARLEHYIWKCPEKARALRAGGRRKLLLFSSFAEEEV